LSLVLHAEGEFPGKLQHLETFLRLSIGGQQILTDPSEERRIDLSGDKFMEHACVCGDNGTAGALAVVSG
jgi:hypothetical protein